MYIIVSKINAQQYLFYRPAQRSSRIRQVMDQCFSCHNLVTYPIKCCDCQAPYCFKCGSNNIKCSKCKSKWNYQKMQPKGFQLNCPFSNQCTAQLTPETFLSHVLTSDHVDAETKQHYQQQLVNACQIGHQLSLLVDNFKNLTNQQCARCKKVGLARQQCEQCNTIYCVICRPILFVDKSCSQSHKLSHVTPQQNLPFLCDRCGKNKKNPKGYYVDKKCNIGICEECFDDLG